MAKISTRGATEIARFTTRTGATYVLRSDGKVLGKPTPAHGYTVVPFAGKLDLDAFRRVCARWGGTPGKGM